MAAPPTFNPDSVMLNKVPMSLCKKINSEVERLCLCHFQKCKTFFICGRCEATICKEPPYECPICKIIVIMPIDMHNHLVNIWFLLQYTIHISYISSHFISLWWTFLSQKWFKGWWRVKSFHWEGYFIRILYFYLFVSH